MLKTSAIGPLYKMHEDLMTGGHYSHEIIGRLVPLQNQQHDANHVPLC